MFCLYHKTFTKILSHCFHQLLLNYLMLQPCFCPKECFRIGVIKGNDIGNRQELWDQEILLANSARRSFGILESLDGDQWANSTTLIWFVLFCFSFDCQLIFIRNKWCNPLDMSHVVQWTVAIKDFVIC